MYTCVHKYTHTSMGTHTSNGLTIKKIVQANPFREELHKNILAYIAEAFNVLHDTGLTPRELAEHKADLIRTLNMAVNCLRVCHQELHEAGCNEAADDTYRDILAYMDTLSKYEPAK